MCVVFCSLRCMAAAAAAPATSVVPSALRRPKSTRGWARLRRMLVENRPPGHTGDDWDFIVFRVPPISRCWRLFRYYMSSSARWTRSARLQLPPHAIHAPANAQRAVFVGTESGPGTAASGAEPPNPPGPPPHRFCPRTDGKCSCECTDTLINRLGGSIVFVNYN